MVIIKKMEGVPNYDGYCSISCVVQKIHHTLATEVACLQQNHLVIISSS
jgi:hypothetical protein